MSQAVKNNTLENVQNRLEKDMVDQLLYNTKPKGADQFTRPLSQSYGY
jgi:hypothetical protein